MSQRDPQVTVVERYPAAPAAARFERELLDHARRRETRRGCVSRLTAVLTGRRGYVHIDRWSGLDLLLRVVHATPAPSDPTPSHTELLVSVGSVAGSGTPAGAARLVFVRATVTGDPEKFELAFGALAGACLADERFGGSELLRSVADPYAYTGLLWWQDAEAYERDWAGAPLLARRAELATLAHLTEEPAEPLGQGAF
ncbi:hypothetical protein ABZ930_37755 [Streptomyces sp. NPDC046716]|uniref:hypothetical protein n=1 Tax=Streptomyces sp. NPDC046716 TaxID=3157093 RepID=UPI0033E0A6E7